MVLQIRVLVKRDVDLKRETECDRRSLLRSNSDAQRVLNDYMDLYDEIVNLAVMHEGKAYTLNDVCHMLDSAAAGCEVCLHHNSSRMPFRSGALLGMNYD